MNNIVSSTQLSQPTTELSEHDKQILAELVSPDAPKPEVLPLSKEHQQQLLASLLFKTSVFENEYATLKTSWFTDVAHQKIFSIAKDHYRQYGTLPTQDIVEAELVNRIGASNPGLHYYRAELETLFDIGEGVASKTQWLLDQIDTFRKSRKLYALMNQHADALLIKNPAKRKEALQECYNTYSQMITPAQSTERKSYSIAELRALPPQQWLIEGLAHKKAYVQIYGASEIGKSFFAVDMALSVATGRTFLNHFNVAQGPVVYVAGEGGDGFTKRLDGWLLNNGSYDTLPDVFRVIKSQYRLVDMAEAVALLATINHDAKKYFGGVQPALIVIDTLANCFGGNEDMSADMSLFNTSCLYLQSQTGATVAVVHHTGRDKSREKGNTRLRDSNDMIIKVEGSEHNPIIKVHCDKAKDVERFASFQVRKKEMPVGNDKTLVLSYVGLIKAESNEAVAPIKDGLLGLLDTCDDIEAVEASHWQTGDFANLADLEKWARCLPTSEEDAVHKGDLRALTGRSVRQCRQHLELAEEALYLVSRTGEGVQGKRSPIRYWRTF